VIEADIIIVGSGPAGINAAWPLVMGGLSVAMIDADDHPLPPAPERGLDVARSDPDHWKYVFGEDFGGLAPRGDLSPKLATPRGRAVLEGGNRNPPHLITDNFVGARSSNAGGLSAIWGAVCSAFDDQDLAGFPLSGADLADGYRAVANRIGISGAHDDLAAFHGKDLGLQEPTLLTYPARHLLMRYQAGNVPPEFRLGRGRNAVLTQGSDNRLSCNGCGFCLLGCARGCIYNSAYEIPALQRYPNFRYIGGMPVRRLRTLRRDMQEIELQAGSVTTIARARLLLLGAGTINSTALVMNYAGMFDTQVRLLSNPVAAMSCVVPKAIGRAPPSQTFGLGQLSFRLDLPGAGYATGAIYGADTLPVELFARRIPLSRPAALRVGALLTPALLPLNVFLPGRYSANILSLRRGNDGPNVLIEGHLPQQAKDQLVNVGKRLGRILAKFGAYPVPMSFTLSPPGADLHLVGTMPMNGSGVLACDSECRLNFAPGVYLIDGSWMPDLPAKHCTFTIMANAYRVGSIIAEV
jgi:choline dehydrogenase-like flavoprotein